MPYSAYGYSQSIQIWALSESSPRNRLQPLPRSEIFPSANPIQGFHPVINLPKLSPVPTLLEFLVQIMSFASSDATHPPPSRSSNLSQRDVLRQPNKFLKTSIVGVIGCPFSGGQPKAGVDTGPHHLIDFGLLEQIKDLGYEVAFGGHQQFAEVMTNTKEHDPDIGKLKRPRYVGRVTQAISKEVEAVCRRGELALTLGGDHSLAIATVSGVFAAYPDACLIWIDAVRNFK